MLVYQLQTRIFQIENGVPFSFPAEAHVQVKLAPGSAFGTVDEGSRTMVRAHKGHILFNANTGKWVGQSEPPLGPIDVTVRGPNSEFKIDGDTLSWRFPCESLDHLQGTLMGLKWILPALLNLEFRDPPIVLHARGAVGGTTFRWEHRPGEWRIQIYPVLAEELEKHVVWSWEHISLFNGIANRRLAAALCYFHTASRLIVAGDSPWEFMSEAILNLAKCLDVLFVRSKDKSRDDLRRELALFGYTRTEIDGDFVPILLLRNQVDVGHPRIALFKPEHLRVLYRYMTDAEYRFREMLRRVVNAVAAGEYHLRQPESLKLSPADQRGMDRLVEVMNSRSLGPSSGPLST